MEQQRGLAFYKVDKTPWTVEEYNNIIDYCETTGDHVDSVDIIGSTQYKYIFDTDTDTSTTSICFMSLQSSTHNKGYKACTKISYESIFHKQQLQTFCIKDYS